VARADDLQRLGLVVGRVVDVVQHPGARAPSVILTVDLGPGGRREGTLALPEDVAQQLVGTQVVCVPDDELLVLGAHSHAHGFVLVRPDRQVEDGTIVS
jgi:tRNA-binding EMAP/Myf-like protein